MTECSEGSFRFQGPGRREIVGRFDGGDITSDGGVVLLGEVEKRTGILDQFSYCFEDHRDPGRVEHSVPELVSQRVYGIALGYEDLNDHDDLRHDPLLAAVVGKTDPKGERRARKEDRGKALAGKSTLNRLELSSPDAAAEDRYKKIVLHEEAVDQILLDVFLQAHRRAPKEIILDLDATDDPLHGQQEGRFFHGYYNHYCYLPLYIFCGEHLLCARLRRSNIDASAGAVEELERIVGYIRRFWPKVKIMIRADSGFCRESIMSWCDAENVDFVLGMARNARLEYRVHADLMKAFRRYERTGKAARVFAEFRWTTLDSWSRKRRVVAKAEHLPGRANPRFVVTSLKRKDTRAREVYEGIYCGRSDMENRIKEQQLYLFADRTSSSHFRANQIRLYFSSIAYLLVHALRRIALKGTDFAKAQCNTIRLKLLKIGAQVRVTVRKVWVSLSQAYPYTGLFAQAYANLAALRPT